jgi:hypothetical protein
MANTKEYYHYSPDNKYVAVEYLNDSGALGGDEWVTLYKNSSPYFLRQVSRIYTNYNWQEDLDVKWINNKTIFIEGYNFDIDNFEEVIINTRSYD